MTASSNNPPSIDPADQDTLTGAFRFIVNKILQGKDGVLPAKVLEYNRTTNRAKVQPLITVIGTSGFQYPRPVFASLPVLQFGGGGYFINMKLTPGTLGWIVANDRDISLFLQSYEQSPPNTFRKNSFSDGVFIPDIMTGYTIVDNEDLMTIQNLDGTIRIAFRADGIHIVSPADKPVVIDAPLEAKQGLSVTGGSSFSVTGNMELTGNLAVVGDITATGDITPNVPP